MAASDDETKPEASTAAVHPDLRAGHQREGHGVAWAGVHLHCDFTSSVRTDNNASRDAVPHGECW
jgi:hypothetical protein